MIGAWHTKSLPELEKELNTDIASGLAQTEAQARLARFGPNKIPEPKTDSLALIFFRQFKSPLIAVLLAACAIVFFLREFTDAFVILFVLVFNAVIGTIQEGQAQNTLLALKNFVKANATVLRDGKELIIPNENIVPGDVIILQEGEKVPGDARVFESHNLTLDEASLTGESKPIHKIPDLLADEKLQPAERVNMVFKGTHVVGGNGRALAVATGVNTEIGKISAVIAGLETEIPLKADIRKLSRFIIAVVGVVVAFVFMLGVNQGKSGIEMFKTVVSLAVSVIPEGLPVVLTIVLISGVFRMAKRNALVKRLQAVEALGQATVIAVDKTGTITKNEIVISQIFLNGTLFELAGTGYDPKGSVSVRGAIIDPLNHPELLMAGKIAALSANARITFNEESGTYVVTGDPTEAAMRVAAEKIGFKKHELERELPRIGEIPFGYETKYHVTVHQNGDKQFVAVTGAPEAVTPLVKHFGENGQVVPMTKQREEEIEAALIAMSELGLRVVAFAMAELPPGKQLTDADDIPHLIFGGLYGMHDALRPEAREAIAAIRRAGIRVAMITGDHKITAQAIAREAGIFSPGDELLTGNDVERLSVEELSRKLARTTVFARVTPEHKLKIIRAYKARGDIIAMTGDGINDAPSLVAADLGVAMGTTGTEVAKEASDIILLDDNLISIVNAIEEGRSIYKTIKKVILYLFSTSIGEVLTIIGALLVGYPLPVLAVQILWLNLVTDGFLDVGLAMEPKEPELLDGRFKRSKNLVDSTMVARMFIMAVPMMAGTLILFDGVFEHDLPKAMTLALTTLAVFQWFNAWNCRSDRTSIFRANPFTNLYLVGATAIVITLQLFAVYAPTMQKILQTVPLTLFEWVLAIGVGFSIVIAEELRKLLVRNNLRPAHV